MLSVSLYSHFPGWSAGLRRETRNPPTAIRDPSPLPATAPIVRSAAATRTLVAVSLCRRGLASGQSLAGCCQRSRASLCRSAVAKAEVRLSLVARTASLGDHHALM